MTQMKFTGAYNKKRVSQKIGDKVLKVLWVACDLTSFLMVITLMNSKTSNKYSRKTDTIGKKSNKQWKNEIRQPKMRKMKRNGSNTEHTQLHPQFNKVARRARQTHINKHRGDWLGERQDRGAWTKMDTKEVPWGDRVPEEKEQGNNPLSNIA